VLPRSIATKAAFENAMTLDVAMGGSTNTVLHILAAAQEAGVDFTMADIDRISRKVPCLCKVAPAIADVHIEDVHRAGGGWALHHPPAWRCGGVDLRHPQGLCERRGSGVSARGCRFGGDWVVLKGDRSMDIAQRWAAFAESGGARVEHGPPQ